MAFERWQFNSKLQETFGPAARPSAATTATTATAVQGAAVVGEPLLPTTLNENAGDSGTGFRVRPRESREVAYSDSGVSHSLQVRALCTIW